MIRPISLGNLIDVLPVSNLLYRFCRRYVDHCNGENNDNMHRNGEMQWLKEVLPQCTTVFDVGANVGDWTGLALNINPHLQVHCFEPSIATFYHLKVRDFGVSSGQVFLNHLGLSSSPGYRTLYLFSEGVGTNSLYRREGIKGQQTQEEKVVLETLDNYCERKNIQQIDLLKLDVEGHELMVLKGGRRMLAQGKVQRIHFEYGGTYIDAHLLLKDMFELLTSCSFRLYKIYPRELRPVDRYVQRLENFQYQNWVALR